MQWFRKYKGGEWNQKSRFLLNSWNRNGTPSLFWRDKLGLYDSVLHGVPDHTELLDQLHIALQLPTQFYVTKYICIFLWHWLELGFQTLQKPWEIFQYRISLRFLICKSYPQYILTSAKVYFVQETLKYYNYAQKG